MREFKLFVVYTVVQFIGGMAGALVAWNLTDFAFFYDFENYSPYKAGICEAIYTCILCINAHMVGKSSKGLYIETFVVVITVITGAKTIGHLTKNCLNPCLGISMDLIYYFIHGNHLDHVWIYVAGPMVGGVLASFISLFYRDLRLRNENDMFRSSLFFSSSVHELDFLKNS
jgi:glycerol uptake facilitator-like aquaporin